jgi:radical SAM superfamily enzyme YgiQ (UPF0313 family)
MKVLLVRPQPEKETIGLQKVMICEPLELEYLGAYAKEMGHEVKLVDMILETEPLSHFIRRYDPDVVGITGYIAHVNRIKAYSEEIKKVKESCRVIVGGVHAEVVPEDFASPFIDYIVKGNGLRTFGEILAALEAGLPTDSIRGVWGNRLECVKETSFRYPHPDRTLTEVYRSRYYYMFHNPCALIKTSFGCPYECRFCFCRKITDGKYFYRELEDVLEELKSIPEEEIYIVDDDFLVDRNRLLEFCRQLEAQGINKRYLIYGRADFIAANEDVIAKFAERGLRAVIVGLESGNEEELKKYNKKSSVRINEAAMAILKKYNVECYGTFILGTDWDKRDFDSLYNWIRKLGIMFINLQPFTPLPGTEPYLGYKDSLLIPRNEYEKWDLAHLVVKPGKMSIRAYYFNILKVYYKVTMHPGNLLRMIKKYGIRENLKLSLGVSQITMQYLVKLLKN